MAGAFFIFSKIIAFLLLPLTWIFLSFIFSFKTKDSALKKKFLVTAVVLLAILTNPFIANRVMHLWEIPARPSQSITESYDVGIVMGGSTKIYSSKLHRLTYSTSCDRFLQAVDLYKKQKIKKILLSGGSGLVLHPEMKEAFFLKQVLMQMCIPDSDVIIENESRNTYENAKFTAQLLQSKKYGSRFLLITSALHIRRALACFEKQNIKMDTYPVDEHSGFEINSLDSFIVPAASALTDWDALIHEWMGFISYKLMGYV